MHHCGLVDVDEAGAGVEGDQLRAADEEDAADPELRPPHVRRVLPQQAARDALRTRHTVRHVPPTRIWSRVRRPLGPCFNLRHRITPSSLDPVANTPINFPTDCTANFFKLKPTSPRGLPFIESGFLVDPGFDQAVSV